jgi:molybdate transport system substrate-binding protein
MTAVPLKLVSSMATRDVLAELLGEYRRVTGQPVAAEAAGGVDVAKRVQGGEVVDVVVLAADAIDKLIAAGKVVAGSRVDLVRSGVGVAVRAGSARPAIDSEDALKRAVEAASTLSYSTGPSGAHLEKTFERWGILARIRERIVVPPPGVPVASLVADGRAELGFQQLSELLGRPGVDVVGPLPAPTQIMTIFAGGVAAACRRPDSARELLVYLASPAATAAKRRYGMEAA